MLNRRQFLHSSLLAGTSAIATSQLPRQGFAQAPAIITSNATRPMPYGVMSGDITQGSGIIWSRSDRPSRMLIDYALDPSFRNAARITGPTALENTDYTARVNLQKLPSGRRIFYRVKFQDLDFNPFWEFVSGPLNSGTFGPGKLDQTFGPEVKFQSAPSAGQVNLPPSAGLQFFGLVKIDGDSRVMTVSHYDIDGKKLWSIDLSIEDAKTSVTSTTPIATL